MINAARELLADGQWSGFTLDAVAARAGVTRVTVYNQVKSKAGLVDAVLTDLTERAGMDMLLTNSRELTAAAAREFVVEQTCLFWHAERAALRPLFGLAAIDRDIAANLARREQWRTDQIEALVDRLAEEARADDEGGPMIGLGLPRAALLAGLTAATSFPTYDALGPLADDPAAAADVVLRLVIGLTG
ncbi:MAG TPA: helix-turn-helix domain-containing protein [Actinocrinis sp.]|nr:helix-turn-helix domain-containing protein [Actinocrinis sp.]